MKTSRRTSAGMIETILRTPLLNRFLSGALAVVALLFSVVLCAVLISLLNGGIAALIPLAILGVLIWYANRKLNTFTANMRALRKESAFYREAQRRGIPREQTDSAWSEYEAEQARKTRSRSPLQKAVRLLLLTVIVGVAGLFIASLVIAYATDPAILSQSPTQTQP
jgi:hypothetical protein